MNKELFQFISELRLHNNREWFQANKPRYDLLHRQFIEVVQELINRMTLFEPELAGLTPKDCIFRIYRDIRFSPDKTPYKTHFGAYIAAYGGRKSEYAGYYLHLEPGASMLAGGVWCPPPALLKLFRKDRRTDYESRVMRLSRQALLSTAEIIKCVEQDVFSLPSERVLMEKVYGDSETTCQNIASLMKNSRSSQAVTLAVANLYLRQQIIFERIST